MYGSRASTAALSVSTVSRRLSSRSCVDSRSSRERSWKASFWRLRRAEAPRTSRASARASTTKTNATAIQIVRFAAPTLASSERGAIVTSATPSGRPRAARSGAQTTIWRRERCEPPGRVATLGQRDLRASAAKHLLDLVGGPGGRAAAVRRREQALLARPDGDAGDVGPRADGGAEPSQRRLADRDLASTHEDRREHAVRVERRRAGRSPRASPARGSARARTRARSRRPRGSRPSRGGTSRAGRGTSPSPPSDRPGTCAVYRHARARL